MPGIIPGFEHHSGQVARAHRRARSDPECLDPRRYTVVRIADEVVLDLLTRACGTDYEAASRSVEIVERDGVAIPFASPQILLPMKQTVREKDRLDRVSLEQLLAARG